VFGSALGGRTTTRPELVAAELPFSAMIGPVRVRGGLAVINRLFDPLGYDVTADPVATTDGSTSLMWMLTIAATIRLQTLLSHLYVLIPVLDDAKHYWVSEDEIEKLFRHGAGSRSIQTASSSPDVISDAASPSFASAAAPACG
jgi:RNA repair, ligase-Pnkp-associating, region of Hen1